MTFKQALIDLVFIRWAFLRSGLNASAPFPSNNSTDEIAPGSIDYLLQEPDALRDDGSRLRIGYWFYRVASGLGAAKPGWSCGGRLV